MGRLQGWSGWRKYRKLSADWRNIVFYSESGQDWHYFEPLIEVLNDELQRKVTYVTSDENDPGLSRQHELFKTVYIPEGFFLTLHFNMQKAGVVVLTMMDLGNLQLKKSINRVHYIYLFHSLGSTHMVDHANSYDAYDSLFCVGPHHVAELRKRESMTGLKERNLFEYGHPRLENLLIVTKSYQLGALLDNSETWTKPVVLIAPTWGEQSIFNTCGDELTGLLLDAGYHVIVRPHYQTLLKTPEVVEKLKTKYGECDNFEYQDSMGESDTLFRSDILICDWSAMAIEYALGLEKPVLFVDLPRRVRNPDWQDLGIEPKEVSFRELAGDIVSPEHLDEAPEKIERLLENQESFRQTMDNLRSEMVFNIGSSVESGAREITRLADGKAQKNSSESIPVPDQQSPDIPTRKQLFRWLGWFAMANAVIFGLIGLRYLGAGSAAATPLAWLYLVTIYISHHSWLALLPLLILLSPVILLKPSLRWAKTLAILLMAVMIAIIMLDSLLWSQSRFHINILTLKILGSSSLIFAAVMFVIALLFETLLAGRVWSWVKSAPTHRGRLLSLVIAVCFVVAQGIYAWADASYYGPVTSIAQQLPVQRGFTAKKLLVRYGLVDISQSRERQLANRVAGGLDQSANTNLNYPLAPLQCSVKEPLNLLLILVDAMRGDMLEQGLTPALDQFASQRATSFSNHFSGGNSSRMGMFSLFYSLPPGYFGSFEALQKPPVFMDQLAANNYQLGLFSSSNMYRPVTLDRTAFAQVPNLRIETKPVDAPAWQRDRIMTDEWMQWLDQRTPGQPFFGFLFYDAVNEKTYPPEYASRVAVNPEDPMAEKFADYKTSVMFDDELVGQVIADLERRGLADNTVIIVSADHGEEFNENGDGIKGHGSGYSRQQLGVPMLMAWPGMEPQGISHRTSHYDIAPTLLRRMLGCGNDYSDYSSGQDLYDGPQWDWLVAGSYYNYAVLEPEQITVTFPNGMYEVRDNNYRLAEHPQFNGDVLEAVMRENTRFHK